MLVRDADALQRASELDTLVFDKTGTLTEGKPQVVAVKTSLALMSIPRCVLPPRWSRAKVTLARAILDKAADSSLPEVSGFPHPARPWRQRRSGRSSPAARQPGAAQRAAYRHRRYRKRDDGAGLARRHAGAAGGGWSGGRASSPSVTRCAKTASTPWPACIGRATGW